MSLPERRVFPTLAAQFARFVLSGGLSAVVDLGVLKALLLVETPRLAAVSIAFLTSALVNFALHQHFTFKAKTAWTAAQLARYAGVVAFNMGLTAGLVEVLTRGLSLAVMLAKVLTLPVVAASGFVLSRAFVFPQRETP